MVTGQEMVPPSWKYGYSRVAFHDVVVEWIEVAQDGVKVRVLYAEDLEISRPAKLGSFLSN